MFTHLFFCTKRKFLAGKRSLLCCGVAHSIFQNSQVKNSHHHKAWLSSQLHQVHPVNSTSVSLKLSKSWAERVSSMLQDGPWLLAQQRSWLNPPCCHPCVKAGTGDRQQRASQGSSALPQSSCVGESSIALHRQHLGCFLLPQQRKKPTTWTKVQGFSPYISGL